MKEQLKKYIAVGVTAFGVIAASILLVFSIFQFEVIQGFINTIWRIIRPFLYGFVFAYLLLPVYNFINNLMKKMLYKGEKSVKSLKRRERLSNGVAVTVSMLSFLVLIIGFGFLVLPEIISSIISVANQLPDFGRRIIAWAEQLLADNPEIEAVVTDLISRYIGNINNWVESYLLPFVTKLMDNLSSGILTTVTQTVSFLKDLLIGIVAAIYMLLSTKTFSAQSKKLVYSVLKVKTGNIFLKNVRFIHKTFSGFITGKLLDSLIIGFMCYIGMVILKMPYTLLISVIIGVTNIIPFFGPFIGAIPSALLILTVSPLQALYFLIFILVLQQFDGNILGPKILGGTVGIPSFWALFSIIFFSGIFGFLGMIIGMPLFALILSLIAALCKRSLERKSLPVSSSEYIDLKEFDAGTGEKILLSPKVKIRDNPNGKLKRLTDKLRRKK